MSNNDLLKKKVSFLDDAFWLENWKVLFNTQRLDEFFPNNKMSLSEQLNSVVRLTIYLGLLLMAYTKNYKFLYIPIITALFTYIIWFYSKKNIENFNFIEDINNSLFNKNDKRIVKPTQDNPFMNVQMDDYLYNPDREAISKLNNYNNDELNKEIDVAFNYNLYRDVDDVFNKQNSQREFYTMPSTTIPNKQGDLANWLYNVPPTCKENGLMCAKNNFEWLKDSKHRNPFMI